MKKTYQRILASQPVSILNWFKEHKPPKVLENTQWIFECKDYIRFRLTGGSVRGENRLFRLRPDEPEGPVL